MSTIKLIYYICLGILKGKVYKYCLNIVDVASWYKASVLLIDRSSVSVAKAFKKVYSYKNSLLIWPKVLQVDGGSEFRNKVCKVMENDTLKARYGDRVRLCYTDTDSLLVQIQTDDINADLIDMANQFDFSDYPVNHPVRQSLGEEKIKANKKSWSI